MDGRVGRWCVVGASQGENGSFVGTHALAFGARLFPFVRVVSRVGPWAPRRHRVGKNTGASLIQCSLFAERLPGPKDQLEAPLIAILRVGFLHPAVLHHQSVRPDVRCQRHKPTRLSRKAPSVF